MGYEVEAVFVSPRNAVLHCSVEAPMTGCGMPFNPGS